MSERSFSERLLAWYRVSGRHDLPWQQDKTPYRVWVSEIMLQQTQVATVIPYYQRFMASFPTLEDLASATQDQVLQHWSGLGYYARGRNLHKAARQAHEAWGDLPDDVEALEALPGIGHSTAGAISSIAFGRRALILDGNVKRVLARHRAVSGWPGRTAVSRELWQWADLYTPSAVQAGEYAQAIMDLGATLCTRTQPRCGECPVAEDCLGRGSGEPTAFPGKKPKKDKPVKSVRMWLVTNKKGEVLLQQRPAQGLWGGLWVLPEQRVDEPLDAWLSRRGWLGAEAVPLPKFRHSFSHFHLDVEPLLVQDIDSARVTECADHSPEQWYNPRSPQGGIAAPVARLLKSLPTDSTGD
ncbi:A/G-specific adenine glycosylase [gamma proteobacterium HTCC5015]|nr:A/G-specific adenine glycosylase [gamma proteobacterium HTCC5015]